MTALSHEAPRPHGLRRDAEENRCRIISAARQLFAEQGIDVPFEEIAHRAGVGIATLYRRFPTRAALIEEIFAAKAQQYIEAAQNALTATNPWNGFCTYVERICALQAEDRGFNDVLTMSFPLASGLEEARGKSSSRSGAHRRRSDADAAASRPVDLPGERIARHEIRSMLSDAFTRWRRQAAALPRRALLR